MHVLVMPSWYDTVDKPWRGTFVRDQAVALQRSGIETGIAFVERRSLSRLTLDAVGESHFQTVEGTDEVRTLRMKGWSVLAQTTPGSLLWCRLMRRLVRTYVRRFGVPDLFHGHAALWGGHAAMLCALELGRPYVVTEHASSILTGRLSDLARRHAATVYRRASAVIAVSEPLRRSVNGVAGRELAQVIPNAVDADYFTVPLCGRRSTPFTFLVVGDLVRSKRVDLAIRAFAHLRSRRDGVKLVIVGAGDERPDLERLASLYGVVDDVEFAGALRRTQVRRRMWEANALVVASDVETFGVVLLEALATGMPVIATRCGGPQEIVTDDVGILVERGRDGELAAAMDQVLVRELDPAVLRDFVRNRYDLPLVAASLRRVYDSVLAAGDNVVDLWPAAVPRRVTGRRAGA